MFFAKRSAESHSRPGKRSAAGKEPPAPYPPLCRMALRLSGLREPPISSYTPGPASAALPGTPQTPYPFLCRMALRLSGLRHPPVCRPGKAAPPGDDRRHGAAFMPGGGSCLARHTVHARPAVNLFTIVAETAGADGLKIAETFPEGRGSPHGCGLRAVFCMDAASARPEACRDKSKGPRSGDFAGRSPGTGGGGDWPPPVRSLRHARHNADD